jgi:4-carboxymuconolactone decarboxylase
MSTDFPDPPPGEPGDTLSDSNYLPDVYVSFRGRFPEVSDALDALGRALDASGPLDALTRRLVKLGIAVGALSSGAVRSNARKALDEGASPDSVRQVAVLAATTTGFPTSIATLAWIDEVLNAES